MKLQIVSRRGTEEAVTGPTRNRLGGSSLPRGFESHPLRHVKTGEKGKRRKGEKGRNYQARFNASGEMAHGTDVYQQEL